MDFSGGHCYLVRFIEGSTSDMGFTLITFARYTGLLSVSLTGTSFSFAGGDFRTNGHFTCFAGTDYIFGLSDHRLGTGIRGLFFW